MLVLTVPSKLVPVNGDAAPEIEKKSLLAWPLIVQWPVRVVADWPTSTSRKLIAVVEVTIGAAFASCPSMRSSASREVADASDALKASALSLVCLHIVLIYDTQLYFYTIPYSPAAAT